MDATIGDGQAVGTINNDDVPAGGFVVNTTADTIDDNLCLPVGSGNGCTLREAINAANASPAATAINFAIPANDARHFYYKDDGVAESGNHEPDSRDRDHGRERCGLAGRQGSGLAARLVVDSAGFGLAGVDAANRCRRIQPNGRRDEHLRDEHQRRAQN